MTCSRTLPVGLHVLLALLLFASSLVHVPTIFRFRRVSATQKMQMGKDRLKLRFLQRAITNTYRGCCFRFVEGNENGGQPQPGLAQCQCSLVCLAM